MSLRKIYYAFSPSLRILIRKLAYFPIDLIRKDHYENGLPVPPRALIYTGGGDFKSTGLRFLTYFKEFGLKTNYTVLDIGSGIGRMALPLTQFLTGNYIGLDIMKQGVRWCQKHISPRFPNFQFRYLDVKNDLYKSTGVESTEISFPVMDKEVDFAILISVFTHMQPEEVEHYLKEISRCLKVGGTCFATFFIYKEIATLTDNNFNSFYLQDDTYALMDTKVKAANVAYHYDYLMSIFEQNGLICQHYSKGKWKDNKSQTDFQDFVVLKKGKV